jgi:hypothetical protein
MKIVDSQLQMQARHSYREQYLRQEKLQAWVGERPSVNSLEVQAEAEEPVSRLDLSSLQQRLQQSQEQLSLSAQAQGLKPSQALLSGADKAAEDEPYYDLEYSLLKALVERFAGREIKLMKPSDLEPKQDPMQPPTQPPDSTEAAADAPQPQGWGLIYDYYERYHEQETSSFSASGQVLTADGQQIDIQLELRMSREFQSELQINLRAGDALIDPLVVNYAGKAAELTQRHFAFDLDRDGRLDQMRQLASGSAYLALDHNQDGRINDGGELFGPSSGRGFAELAEHDQNANGWIDANDSIYQRLRLWSRNEDGSDRLIGLGQVGIGALYLGHVESPFLLKDGDNQLQGRVRETGLFLRENGSSGTLQELDLVV